MINPEFVALLNKVLADRDPGGRVHLASDLATGFGRLLFIPPAGLEQLINAMQADADSAKLHARSALQKLIPGLGDEGAAMSELTLETLRIFLKHRPAIVADYKAFNPDGDMPE